mgnify:CR=1 FL=1
MIFRNFEKSKKIDVPKKKLRPKIFSRHTQKRWHKYHTKPKTNRLGVSCVPDHWESVGGNSNIGQWCSTINLPNGEKKSCPKPQEIASIHRLVHGWSDLAPQRPSERQIPKHSRNPTQSQQMLCKVGCRCAFLFVSMEFNWVSQLILVFDRSGAPRGPRDFNHALTHELSDFQWFWATFFFRRLGDF